MARNNTVVDPPNITALSIAEDTSAEDVQLSPSSSERPLNLLDLPQEALDNVFRHVYAQGMPYPEKARYKWWRIDSASEELDSRQLVLLVQVPCEFFQLLASAEFFQAALYSYCVASALRFVLMKYPPLQGSDCLPVKKGSKLREVFSLLLEKTRTLRVEEAIFRYNVINQNLDAIQGIFPQGDRIDVTLGRYLVWEERLMDGNTITVFHNGSWYSQGVVQLNQARIAELQRNNFPGDHNAIYNCVLNAVVPHRVSVSQPRSDGVGLSCTTADWPARKYFHIKAWCKSEDVTASVDIVVDLKTNQVVKTMLTLHPEFGQFGFPTRIKGPEMVHHY